jgi:CheY-like chemotaxis protein
MPNLNGLQLLQRLRSEHPGVPVVAVSAFVDAPDVASAGFDEVLRKPVSVEDVRRVVDNLLDEDDD